MAGQWIKSQHKGLRYREHQAKTVGVGRYKRPLRYFMMTYKWGGKNLSESLGWEDEIFSEWQGKPITGEAAATHIHSLLRNNRLNNTPPFTLGEMRADNQTALDEQTRLAEAEIERDKLEEATRFDRVFADYCEANSGKVSLVDEQGYYRSWIGPAIGARRLDEIILLDLERIKKKMASAGRAPRSVGYVKSIVRQVFHFASDRGLFTGEPPTAKFLRNQKTDNKRLRYLEPNEADQLLPEIHKHSEQTYRISLLSLNSGMRFGEIAALRWQHVNTDRREIIVVDAKNGQSRAVYMTEAVLQMLLEMKRGKADELVFPAKMAKGEAAKQMERVSNVFMRAVDTLGLNDGITDRRTKLVFHSLRHSCASWLVNAGVELPTIAKILGHKTLQMTMRYSHVNDTSVRSAMAELDRRQEKTPIVKIVGGVDSV